MTLILTEFKDGVGTLTMNDPAKRNALSRALTADAAAALADFKARGARAVILRAARGTKVWSAGYDITELGDVEVDALGSSDGIRTLARAVEAFPAPVIALLEGGVFGAACELAMVSDLIVATPNVSFTITPARLGLVYNVSGLIALTRRLPIGIVKEMAFTAQPVSADRAHALGIINHIVAADDVERFTFDLAARIAALAPLAIATMKEELRILADVVALSPRTVEEMQRLRRRVWASADYREGITAFHERRNPVFRGE